jgi:hypothetical protein
MSAFGGKADMTLCGNPLLRSPLGVKRTCCFALQMSAYDQKGDSPTDYDLSTSQFCGCSAYVIGDLAAKLPQTIVADAEGIDSERRGDGRF